MFVTENLSGFDKVGVRTKSHKLISKKSGYECYDLTKDPLELDGKGCSKQVRELLESRLVEFMTAARALGRVGTRPRLSAADIEMLKSLGYIE